MGWNWKMVARLLRSCTNVKNSNQPTYNNNSFSNIIFRHFIDSRYASNVICLCCICSKWHSLYQYPRRKLYYCVQSFEKSRKKSSPEQFFWLAHFRKSNNRTCMNERNACSLIWVKSFRRRSQNVHARNPISQKSLK